MTSTLLWLAVTVAVYLAAAYGFARSRHALWALPVVTGTTAVLLVLSLAQVPYADYARATSGLRWLSGPAVISLAVPLYRQTAVMRPWIVPLLLATLAGSATSIAATWVLASWLHLPPAWVVSLLPKSVTMPIAMGAAHNLGGVPALAALAVAFTGVAGTCLTPPLLRLAGIRSPQVEAFALGLSAHAIGTARVIQRQPQALAFAALAMGLNGVCTALLLLAVASALR
jgi:putative effector of murein hydrolase